MVWGCGFMTEGLGFGRFCTHLEDKPCRGGSQHEGFRLKNPYDRNGSTLEATGSTLMSIGSTSHRFPYPLRIRLRSTSDLFRKRTRPNMLVSIIFSIIPI